MPAEHVPRTQPWRTLGWVLPLAVAALFAVAVLAEQRSCAPGGLAAWMRLLPSFAQIAAAWDGEAAAACGGTQRPALAWDTAFIAAYAAWIAYPVAWALRRLVAQAVPLGRPIGWLPRHAHWCMALLVAADLAENLAQLAMPAAVSAKAVAVLAAVRLLCLALLAAVLCLGAAARPSGAGRP